MPIQKTNAVDDGQFNVCFFNNITNVKIPAKVACKINN